MRGLCTLVYPLRLRFAQPPLPEGEARGAVRHPTAPTNCLMRPTSILQFAFWAKSSEDGLQSVGENLFLCFGFRQILAQSGEIGLDLRLGAGGTDHDGSAVLHFSPSNAVSLSK